MPRGRVAVAKVLLYKKVQFFFINFKRPFCAEVQNGLSLLNTSCVFRVLIRHILFGLTLFIDKQIIKKQNISCKGASFY